MSPVHDAQIPHSLPSWKERKEGRRRKNSLCLYYLLPAMYFLLYFVFPSLYCMPALLEGGRRPSVAVGHMALPFFALHACLPACPCLTLPAWKGGGGRPAIPAFPVLGRRSLWCLYACRYTWRREECHWGQHDMPLYITRRRRRKEEGEKREEGGKIPVTGGGGGGRPVPVPGLGERKAYRRFLFFRVAHEFLYPALSYILVLFVLSFHSLLPSLSPYLLSTILYSSLFIVIVILCHCIFVEEEGETHISMGRRPGGGGRPCICICAHTFYHAWTRPLIEFFPSPIPSVPSSSYCRWRCVWCPTPPPAPLPLPALPLPADPCP